MSGRKHASRQPLSPRGAGNRSTAPNIVAVQRAGNAAICSLLSQRRESVGGVGAPTSPVIQRHGAFAPTKKRLGSPRLQVQDLHDAASSASPPLELRKSSGAGVSVLQEVLGVAQTAVYDRSTKAAVAAFQKTHGIPFPTGIQAGPKTLTALDNHLLGGDEPARQRCNYDADEKQVSARSAGGVEVINPREFLLTDFTPGGSTLKSEHIRFLTKLFDDLSLNNPFGDDTVLLVGSTDCVSEDITADNQLRLSRARSAAAFLNTMGALDGRVSAVQDPLGRISGDNGDRAGRARNRHVRISVSKVRPDDPDPPKPNPVPKPVPAKQTFLVRATGGASGGEIVQADLIHMVVVDRDRLLEADFSYTGIGLGGSLLPITRVVPGKFSKVTVDSRSLGHSATLRDFTGNAGLLSGGAGETSVAILDVGRGFGRVPLDGVALVPGAGATAGVIQMQGEPGRHDPNKVDPDDGA